MSTMLERLPRIIEMAKEDLPLFLERRNTDEDHKGRATQCVMSKLRDLGIAAYILEGDVATFRQRLSQVAALQKELIDRFENGEPISRDYVSILTYKELLDALAAADCSVARQLAEVMENRDDDSWITQGDIEVVYEGDPGFPDAMCYGLKAFVLDRRGDMQHWTLALERSVRSKKMKNLSGYAQVLRGILDEDVATANRGLQAVVEGHVKEAKRGIFNLTLDELLCVWGVGVANLARHCGVPVSAVPPLIPADLLIG